MQCACLYSHVWKTTSQKGLPLDWLRRETACLEKPFRADSLCIMFKQETDPAKLRALILSQPRVSAEQMDAQIRAGIAWSRGSSLGSSGSHNGESTGAASGDASQGVVKSDDAVIDQDVTLADRLTEKNA